MIHLHFVGIGGIGMSAVAAAAHAAGYLVSGSDRQADVGGLSETLPPLQAAGIAIHPQDGRAVHPGLDAVVASTAIEPDNPDLAAASACGVPALHRSVMLARLLEGKQSVAITGTSGKSTVTAMAGWLLQQCGADPTVVNGAAVPAWQAEDRVGNFRAGHSNLWVFEADESDRSLSAYTPDWVVITNISADHFPSEEARALFRDFAGRARHGALSAPDEPTLLNAADLTTRPDDAAFHLGGVPFRVSQPGLHNALNARLAVELCRRLLTAPPPAGPARDEPELLTHLAVALETFPGVHRRLEWVGEAQGIRVLDDYAHNPAKIRAAWTACRREHGRVIGVWRPHGYGPLRAMLDDLARTFTDLTDGDDRLILLPVYDAGGTADRSINSEALAAMLTAGKRDVRLAEPDEAPELAVQAARSGDTILLMGARDPNLPVLARAILRALGSAQA